MTLPVRSSVGPIPTSSSTRFSRLRALPTSGSSTRSRLSILGTSPYRRPMDWSSHAQALDRPGLPLHPRAVEWSLLKYGVVSLFLTTGLYVHFRGKLRHGF